jgi:hypothetical protein
MGPHPEDRSQLVHAVRRILVMDAPARSPAPVRPEALSPDRSAGAFPGGSGRRPRRAANTGRSCCTRKGAFDSRGTSRFGSRGGSRRERDGVAVALPGSRRLFGVGTSRVRYAVIEGSPRSANNARTRSATPGGTS